ncbi:putative transposase [Orientia tsutsugamushi str. Sido]|nr:putative transposase [Orientia tsutsugamushi str. Sido]
MIKSLIESVECTLLYLSTYSQDLNLIEHYWFKVKITYAQYLTYLTTFFDDVFFISQCVTTFQN